MKMLLSLGCVFFATLSMARAQDRTPIIVELFTSEGCSSCPPADELLARLLKDQPVKDAQVIGLAFHVDYWNKLGWPDRFSSREFTQRQNDYAAANGSGRIYTPQMIVDGAREFVGNDATKARTALIAAAANPKRSLDPVVKELDAAHLKVQVSVSDDLRLAKDQSADLLVALTEDDLTSEVARGENAGRTLHHLAVVRQMKIATTVTGPDQFKKPVELELALDKSWDARKLSVVAFVQDRQSRRILAAGAIELVAAGQ
jgi:hypothetical protein